MQLQAVGNEGPLNCTGSRHAADRGASVAGLPGVRCSFRGDRTSCEEVLAKGLAGDNRFHLIPAALSVAMIFAGVRTRAACQPTVDSGFAP